MYTLTMLVTFGSRPTVSGGKQSDRFSLVLRLCSAQSLRGTALLQRLQVHPPIARGHGELLPNVGPNRKIPRTYFKIS